MHETTETRKIPGAKIGTMPEQGGEAKSRPIRHLYIHIPFCPRICPYCAFHILTVNKALAARFLENLLKEWRGHQAQLAPETIYFGGGTPTALSVPMLEELLGTILKPSFEIQDHHHPAALHDSEGRPRGPSRFSGTDFPEEAVGRAAQQDTRAARATPNAAAEISMECNPLTLSADKAALLARHGVNRLSIGAQSFDPAILRVLGRAHTPEAVARCVATARAAGIRNLNLDLIFGVPGQSPASWRATLEAALALRPQHVSCYGLTYEQDTEFFRLHARGQMRDDPASEQAMFEQADALLTAAGYRHYEVSNYVLPGFECRHNLACWRGRDYLGLGPSAVSTLGPTRRRNRRITPEGAWDVEEVEALPPDTRAAERMALGLRTAEGIDEAAFVSEFGFSPQAIWPEEICRLAEHGLIQTDPIRPTARGMLVADEIAQRFL